MGKMKIGLDSANYVFSFESGTLDLKGFINKTRAYGFDGIQINTILGGQLGHLRSADRGYLKEIASQIKAWGMYVEVNTKGTTPTHLTNMISICSTLGADVLRTYLDHHRNQRVDIEQAVFDLKQIQPFAKDCGVCITMENHEYETSYQMIDLIDRIGDDNVKLLVDIGNPMMVWEDPVTAVSRMAPYAISAHFKDLTIVMNQGIPTIVGASLGNGNIDYHQCFKILATTDPAIRINLQEHYGYSTHFKRAYRPENGQKLGVGAFRIHDKAHNRSQIALDLFAKAPADRSAQELAWREAAVEKSIRKFLTLNEAL